VGRWVTGLLTFDAGDGEDTIALRDHGSDRDLAAIPGFAGCRKGAAHHREIPRPSQFFIQRLTRIRPFAHVSDNIKAPAEVGVGRA
jgi:hypothetical protein